MAVTGRYIFTQRETILAMLVAVVGFFGYNLEPSSFKDVGLRFVYNTCYSLLVGISFWVTFVAGLTMYRILPRNHFASVQRALFPKYMKYSVLFSILALGAFHLITAKHLKSGVKGILTLESGLILTLVTSALNLLMVYPFIRIMDERNDMEKERGIGQGVADSNEECKKLKDTNKKYADLCGRVTRFHAVTAVMNLLSLVGIVIHMCIISYLSDILH